MEKNRSNTNTNSINNGEDEEQATLRSAEEEEEEEKEELAAEMERLKLGPTALWTGLVLHHKDVFVSHVLSKLNGTDRCFFSTVNRESRGALKYAGVNGSELCVKVHECTSVSTLELVWNHVPWGKKVPKEE